MSLPKRRYADAAPQIHCTTKDTLPECCSDPAVPVTVTVYVPAGVPGIGCSGPDNFPLLPPHAKADRPKKKMQQSTIFDLCSLPSLKNKNPRAPKPAKPVQTA